MDDQLNDLQAEIDSNDQSYQRAMQKAIKESEKTNVREDEEQKLLKEIMKASALEHGKFTGEIDTSQIKKCKQNKKYDDIFAISAKDKAQLEQSTTKGGPN
jgi:hypothetical protein